MIFYTRNRAAPLEYCLGKSSGVTNRVHYLTCICKVGCCMLFRHGVVNRIMLGDADTGMERDGEARQNSANLRSRASLHLIMKLKVEPG